MFIIKFHIYLNITMKNTILSYTEDITMQVLIVASTCIAVFQVR